MHHEQQNAIPEQVGLAVGALLFPPGIPDPIDPGRQIREEVPLGFQQQFCRRRQRLSLLLPAPRLSGTWRWMMAMFNFETSFNIRCRRCWFFIHPLTSSTMVSAT